MRRGLGILLALACGCSTLPPPHTPLSPSQIAELQRRARSPEELGLRSRRQPDGTLRLDGAAVARQGDEVVEPIYARPFESAQLPVVQVRLNGRVVLALVDTGSTTSLIEYGAALRCGVVPAGPDLVRHATRGPGGPLDLILGIAETASVGGAEVRRLPLGIVDRARGMESIWWLEGRRVEAILGGSFLGAFDRVTLDLRREQVTFSCRGPYKARTPEPAAATPLAVLNGIPVIRVRVEGRGELNAALDSGSDFGLWVPRPLAAKLKWPEVEDPRGVSMGAGVGGETVFKPARPSTLRIGGLTVPDVRTDLSMLSYGDHELPYALLGNGVLRNYVVTIDYAGRTVFFETP